MDLIGQIAFFREEEHRVTWATISLLFETAQTTLYDALRRSQREFNDGQAGDLAHPALPGPNSFLTCDEEATVLH
jgi:hypothetical protein